MSADKKQPAGPPTAGGPAFLVVGRVRRPHGLHGEMVVEIYTDFPERLQPKLVIYSGPENSPIRITSRREHNEGLLLGLEGITTPEQAGAYRNKVLSIAAADAKELSEGEFYFHELMDLKVVDETGRSLGVVTEIIETGANDVYVVTGEDGSEILLPAIPEVILDVDLESEVMKVRLLPGLVDETPKTG